MASASEAEGQARSDAIESFWPEGRYRLRVASSDPKAQRGLEETQVDIEVAPGDGPAVLPPISLKAPMKGSRKLYQRSMDALQRDSGWVQTGSWVVP